MLNGAVTRVLRPAWQAKFLDWHAKQDRVGNFEYVITEFSQVRAMRNMMPVTLVPRAVSGLLTSVGSTKAEARECTPTSQIAPSRNRTGLAAAAEEYPAAVEFPSSRA
jgi:hypothetical protein